MKQVNMPSLEDDPRQTLTIAGLEKGQGTIAATTLTSSLLHCVQTGGLFWESRAFPCGRVTLTRVSHLHDHVIADVLRRGEASFLRAPWDLPVSCVCSLFGILGLLPLGRHRECTLLSRLVLLREVFTCVLTLFVGCLTSLYAWPCAKARYSLQLAISLVHTSHTNGGWMPRSSQPLGANRPDAPSGQSWQFRAATKHDATMNANVLVA